MDNGLIFPYPRRSVPDEPRCANLLTARAPSGVMVGWLGTWWVVVKRWGDAGG